MTAAVEKSDFFEYVDSSLSCSLSRYILAKDVDTVQKILHKWERNPAPLPADNRGWTALHIAASEDEHYDCLKLLLRNKDILLLDLDAKTFKEETALYLACERGCVKNCALLLESKCNPKLPTLQLSTPLLVASENGHVAIVSQLIACDLISNCQDPQGFTPLHLASLNNHPEVVRVLITSTQMSISVLDMYGNLPLHLASRSGAFEVIKMLSEADHSLIDWQNFEGYTPLMLAVQSHCAQCVKYLLDQGANANQCTKDHLISLHYAALSGDKQILKLVLRATSLMCVREKCMLRIRNVLSTRTPRVGIFHSLMSCVIESSSLECMSVLLESGLPKSVLEAPYLEVDEDNDCFSVYSPLSFLLSMLTFEDSESHLLDQFLGLLLRHGITHMNEFSQTVEMKSHFLHLSYVNPFKYILEAPFPPDKRDHYLNMFIENGITTDYCLQISVDRKSIFRNFDVCDLSKFYEPLIKALDEDNVELVEFFLVNSAILEPHHLWDILYGRVMFWGKWRGRNKVYNYLKKISAVFPPSRILEMLKGSSCDVSLFEFNSSEMRYCSLQDLCRRTIRDHLRDVTIEDNLKHFKRKIDALPLPNLLKNYLHFKIR